MLTADQIALRRQFVTASELPAICGVDPYKSAADVWAIKRGLVKDETSPAAERGNWLEPALLDFAAHMIGQPFTRNTMVIRECGIMAANFDGLGDDFAVEGKTSILRDEWGDEGTDEVPERVKVQTAAQFAVAGESVVRIYVPALIAMDLRLYVIDRDEELVGAVVEAAHRFKRDVMPNDRPPAGVAMSLDVLKRIDRVPDKIARVDPAILAQWQQAKAIADEAAEKAERAKAALIASLDDCEVGEAEGIGHVTYSLANRRGIDLDKLRSDFRDAAEACATTTAYRTLRFKPLSKRKGA